jgi:adenylyltransferase/sulfurtransferase
MSEYFSRQYMLWGDKTQELLAQKSIVIVGAGGLGSSLALALSGSGVKKIDIIDFDRVEVHNIHRQVLFDIEDCNEYKAKIVSQKILYRNPFLESNYYIKSFEDFIEQEPFDYDIILDATDNLEVRFTINQFAKKHNIPWVYGSVEEFNGQVALFKEADFSLFASKELETKGIAAPMVMQIASFEANLALRYLANLKVASDIFYYLYYNKDGEFEMKKFNLPKG